MSKYLVASGCSYTGGGGMNNKTLFDLEFPHMNSNMFKSYYEEISWGDSNFKDLIRPYLWPSILAGLLNYDDSYNLASGGKGIYTTTNTLYHFIFDWQKQGKDVRELEIWYQIPSYNRLEVYVNDVDKHKCILTELDDTDNVKKTFITNFFDEDYNLLSTIHEVYKLKKYCDSLGIKIYIIPWDNTTFLKTGMQYLKLKKRISQYNGDGNKPQFSKFFTNITSVEYYDIDLMIDELQCIYINDNSINNHLEDTFDGFYFESKYPNITYDRHMTCIGHSEFAKTLKKIVKKDLEN
jgi:hypothetical protein